MARTSFSVHDEIASVPHEMKKSWHCSCSWVKCWQPQWNLWNLWTGTMWDQWAVCVGVCLRGGTFASGACSTCASSATEHFSDTDNLRRIASSKRAFRRRRPHK